jgi:hypothetical protein
MSPSASDERPDVGTAGEIKALADARHRADYTLERGVWHVSCRMCGWRAEGSVRRQLSSMFRFHLRSDAKLPPGSDSVVNNDIA